MTIKPIETKEILLSFDIEEFDMPFEYQKIISFEEQLMISTKGTKRILEILRIQGIKATFFCTANFALNRIEIIHEIMREGHEIASHGYYHSRFEDEDLKKSKDSLESIAQTEVLGFRMPRMMPVNLEALKQAGYSYNSSLNPTFIPGRYNHFDKPRTFFLEEGTLQIPSSVSPLIRFPLFWLSFHNISFIGLRFLCESTIQKDHYLNLYFHPWEFTDLSNTDKLGMPWYVQNRSGLGMENQLNKLILWGKSKGYNFSRMGDFSKKNYGSPSLMESF